MGEALRVHVLAHLRCLGRHRLVVAFSVVALGAVGLAVAAGLAVDDDWNRFQTLKQLAQLLHATVRYTTAGVGVFLVWEHRRGRALRLVATTAAPMGAWVGSVFATAALVGAAAHAASAVLVFALSAAWGVTYQFGFLFLALDRLAESLVSLAVLTTLASVWHPLLAIVAASVASETAALAIRRAVDVWPGGVASEAARQAVTGLYYLLPASDPFGERTAAMLRSMRPADSDWRYLVLSFAYAFLVVAFAQVVTTMRLTRRPS